MKKVYIKPGCFKIPVEGCVILAKSGEPQDTENIGAKEFGDSFEDVEEDGDMWSGSQSSSSLWGDETEEE